MTIITSETQRPSSHTETPAEQSQVSQCLGRIWEVGKEVASTALPFLTLYKPFSYPVALGMGGLRVGISTVQLIDAIHEKDQEKIFSASVATTVAVISLAGTIFAHPLGMVISTGYDLILEFRTLVQHFQEENYEHALQSGLKILGHSLYLTVCLYGGPEIAISFFAVQILVGILESRQAFAEEHYIAGIGHALMSILRGSQLAGQVHTWHLIKKIEATESVGKLAEKWQFPSDHLPVGAKVGQAHVISWNVLNNRFMGWVIENDSQGLNGSLISQLHEQKSLKYEGLTLRDELVLSYLDQMMTHSPHRDQLILSLQECSPEFIRAFQTRLPPHMDLILPEDSLLSKDHNIVIYNKLHFDYLKDESSIDFPFTLSGPKQPVMNVCFLEKATQERFQFFHAHIPGDPNMPGRNEFASHVLMQMKSGYSTIALGDMNFTESELQQAFDEESAKLNVANPFKNLAYYNTNIDPGTLHAKGIDHIWVNTKLPCDKMKPNDVIPGLQTTVDLLNPNVNRYWELMEDEKLEDRKKQDLHMLLKTEALYS